jgi:hypothetical protein
VRATLDQILAHEDGELDTYDTLCLFAALVSDGTVWHLQGSYGRQAAHLLDSGLIDTEGNVTPHGEVFADRYDQ